LRTNPFQLFVAFTGYYTIIKFRLHVCFLYSSILSYACHIPKETHTSRLHNDVLFDIVPEAICNFLVPFCIPMYVDGPLHLMFVEGLPPGVQVQSRMAEGETSVHIVWRCIHTSTGMVQVKK